MKRATVIYGAVLVLLMAASWVQWTADEPLDLEGKVVVLQGDADAITAVRWVSDESEATVSRKSDDLGTFYWVDYTRWTERRHCLRIAQRMTRVMLTHRPRRSAFPVALNSRVLLRRKPSWRA